jgi:RNA polymerase sigma factor (sigma-70 family)
VPVARAIEADVCEAFAAAGNRRIAPGKTSSLTFRRPGAFKTMMPTITTRRAPPFERFYEAHRDEVFRYLVRLLGREAAEDAFQETFLRALRAYGELRHSDNLRAWAFTIATRVASDERRRPRAATELPELPAPESRPAYAELERFTAELPPTERAAVVLRYGYDLAYADIAVALDSTEEAARQAASSGVRRLRRKGIR